MDKEEILAYFNQERQFLLNYTLKSNRDKYGITPVDTEAVVDELIVKILKSKATFESPQQLNRYIWVSLKRNLSCLYARKKIENMPLLTNKERSVQFELARNIIDKNRQMSHKLATV